MNCVYKIVCKDPTITEFYIGSTKDLNTRGHKTKCNNPKNESYNIPLYQFIRSNGGWDNWDILVLEEIPNYDKNNRLKLEQFYKDKLKPKLNSINAYGLDIDRYNETNKTYIENNKDKIKEQRKIYRQTNKQQIKEYNQQNKLTQNILKKKWAKKIINCPICNETMIQGSLSRHKKRMH